MSNTFWTFIEDGYYRIFDGTLRYAPSSNIDNTILLSKQEIVKDLAMEKLKLINHTFNLKLLMSDFKNS